MPAAVETMFSHRELPWHGLGLVVDEAPTSADAIKLAGLDWEVEKRQQFVAGRDGRFVPLPGVYAMTRVTDDRYLGTVKSRYQPFQNRDAFEFADHLVGEKYAYYETAGSLRDGRMIFMSMHVPEAVMVAGEDRHDAYILLRTAHDGSASLGAYVTMIRPVCMNTVTLGIQTATHKWTMPHVGDLQSKIAEARQTLELTNKYVEAFSALGDRLMHTPVDRDRSEEILRAVLPNRPRTDEVVEAILDCTEESQLNGYSGTGWGLVNGLTEYQQWYRENTQPEATFFNVIDGPTASYRNRVSSMLLEVA